MTIINHPTVEAGKSAAAPQSFNVAQIREQFPILKQLAHGHPLVYLDNAATTQKPSCVIDTLERYYSAENANIHRGIHLFSERATKAFEAVREKVRHFINAKDSREIVFLRG